MYIIHNICGLQRPSLRKGCRNQYAALCKILPLTHGAYNLTVTDFKVITLMIL